MKQIIQKEEYIALAINKYIAQTAKIPKKTDNTLNWALLTTKEYLGVNFNKKNPITSKNIEVIFDTNNNSYIKGVLSEDSDYNIKYKFLYNFYANKIFRVNTISPDEVTKDKLLKGSQVKYGDTQKKVISFINSSKTIKLPNETCTLNSEYYEYENGKLTLKYCKGTYSFEVYQKEPIYMKNNNDLNHIKAKIGSKAYVVNGTDYFQYYYDGTSWIEVSTQDRKTEISIDVEKYYQKAQAIIIRYYGGCYLKNGDVFCWGDNRFFQAGTNSVSNTWINTPIKLQVESASEVKFTAIARNKDNVCAISEAGVLYCNGKQSAIFSASSSGAKAKLTVNTKFTGYNLVDLAMLDGVEELGTMLVVATNGKAYIIGSNGKSIGLLGKGITSTVDIIKTTPEEITWNIGYTYTRAYALTEEKMFALQGKDSSDNYYIFTWGKVSFESSGQSYPKRTNTALVKDSIKVNPNVFIFKEAGSEKDCRYGAKTAGTRHYCGRDLAIFQKTSTVSDRYTFNVDKGNPDGTVDKKKLNYNTHSKNDLVSCKNADGSSCNANDQALFDNTFAILNADNKVGEEKYGLFSYVGVFQGKRVLPIANDDIYILDGNLKTDSYGAKYIEGDISLNDKFVGGYTYRIKTGPTQGSFAPNSNGSFTYYPSAPCVMYDSFEYEIIDSKNKVLSTAKAHIYEKKYSSPYSNDFFVNKSNWNVKGFCKLSENIWHDANYDYGWGNRVQNKFLGIFGKYPDNNINTNKDIVIDGTEQVNKTFYFGRENANKEVTLKFDFIEIDSWDDGSGIEANADKFKVYINKEEVFSRTYSYVVFEGAFPDFNTTLSSGIEVTVQDKGTDIGRFESKNINQTGPIQWLFKYDTYHQFLIKTKLDKNGMVSLGFGAKLSSTFDGGLIGEAFGIDNIDINVKDYNPNSVPDGTLYIDDFTKVDPETINNCNVLGWQSTTTASDECFFNPDKGNSTDENTVAYGNVYEDNYDNKQLTSKEYAILGEPNAEVDIEYLIDIRDRKHSLYFYINDEIKKVLTSNGDMQADYKLTLKAQLNNLGNLKLGFGFNNLSENVTYAFGIKQISIISASQKMVFENTSPFVCTTVGLEYDSKLYCWGSVGRALPIINSALYDESKVDDISKLFITKSKDINNNLYFNSFFDTINSNLFLKYPTYIGNFDHPIYFK